MRQNRLNNNFIHKLRLKNFKNIVENEYQFTEQFTVLIGDNGTGKTAILDALAIIAGAYLLGVDEVQSRSIQKDEIRRENFEHSVEHYTPVEIWAEGDVIDGHNLTSWGRSLNSINGKTNNKASDEIIHLAEQQANEARHSESTNLPLISYFGTGRLWAESAKPIKYKEKDSRLKEGYQNCLNPKATSKDFLAWYKTFEDEALKFNKNKDLLEAFNNAIVTCIPHWKQISFSFAEDDLMGLYKSNESSEASWMPYRLLSDGYRNIIGIVADIAYRCIMLNPYLGINAVLETYGIVLIDEIDLHLHPKWQKEIVEVFRNAFPKIQFIVTTHSPFIVQSLRKEELINLSGEIDTDPFLKSIEEIAEDEMDVENVQRSKKFMDMENTAEEFFKMVKEGKTAKGNRELAGLKDELDKQIEDFSIDPAFTALLKAERDSSKK